MVEEKKPDFPIIYSGKCPICGTEGAASKVKAEELAKGKMAADAPIGIIRIMSPVTDQAHVLAQLSVPILVSLFDICSNPECGVMFCTRIERQQGMPQVQPPTGAPPRPPSFLNRQERRHPLS